MYCTYFQHYSYNCSHQYFSPRNKRIRPSPLHSSSQTNSGNYTDDEDYGSSTNAISPFARLVNYAALGFFVLVVLIFNIVFWTVALGQYNTTAEDLLREKRAMKPIR